MTDQKLIDYLIFEFSRYGVPPDKIAQAFQIAKAFENDGLLGYEDTFSILSKVYRDCPGYSWKISSKIELEIKRILTK